MSNQDSSMQKYWLPLAMIGCVALGFIGRGFWDAAASPKSTSPFADKTQFDFIVGGPDPFWNTVVAGARAAADQYGVDLVVHTPSGKPADQTNELAEVEARGSSGVAISPIAPDEQSLLLSRLATKSLLVTFDNDAPQSLRHCYVGTNNYLAGKICAKAVEDALPEGGKIVVFIGDVERDNAKERLRGFHAQLVGENKMSDEEDYPLNQPYGEKWTVIQTYLDDQNPEQAQENVKQSLKDHPDIDCMVGLYGYNGPACLAVLKESDKLSDIKIVAFDEHDATLDGIAKGEIAATVVQGTYEYGFESVRLLTSLHNSNEHSIPLAGTGFVFLPCSVVTKDNLEEHRAKLAKRLEDNKSRVDSGKMAAKGVD